MTADRRHRVDGRGGAPPSHGAAAARLVVRGVVRGHVETAVGVLRDHLAEPWTLDSLAKQVHLSRSQLVRAFNAVTSLGPMAYLRLMRVQPDQCRQAESGAGKRSGRDTGCMVDDIARDRSIYHALKAVDEVAAALQTHLIEEHGADPERAAPQSPSTNSLVLLRQARERLGEGLRTINADSIAESDEISLRNQ